LLADKQWKYPKKIAIAQTGTIDALIVAAFPTDVWTEIDQAEFQKLKLSYR